MKYCLCDDVRCVIGKIEAALYCFNQNKIIRLKRQEGEKILAGNLSNAEAKQLLAYGIIKETSQDITPKQNSESDINDKASTHFKKVWLELTPKCNLKCSHCYIGENPSTPTTSDWNLILDYLTKWGCEEYVLLGGEPFCSENLFPFIKKIQQKNAKAQIIIITNGTLCTFEQLDWIKDNKISLHFSLLGKDANSHDNVTQVPGSFDKLLQNMTYAHSIGLKASIICTLSEMKWKEEIKNFSSRVFPNFKISFHSIRPQGRELCHGTDDNKCSENTLATHISRKYFEESHYVNTCLNGKIAISYDGKVYPCIMSRYVYKLFADISSLTPSFAFADWWQLTKDKIEGCRDCALRYACFDCRGYASSLYGPSNVCALVKGLMEN